ncbi:hypothetical protein [Roseibium sp.]|uniref:hypothetical protein n=1 Tax=Roseibium sp. TaxID=1936156 RepID=UPI0039EE45AC
MKVPTVNPRRRCPPILLGTIDLDLPKGFGENILDLFRAKPGRVSNREQLIEYFALFFGLGVFDAEKSQHEVWVYDFAVIDIQNKVETADFGTSDIGLAVSLFSFLARQPSVSVTLEGQLTEARTGKVVSSRKIKEEFAISRSIFTRCIKSLPMIEVAAVKLLKSLKEEAQFNVTATV